MEAKQSTVNNFFALPGTIFSLSLYTRGTTLGKKKIVKNYCKILSVSLKIKKRISWVLSLIYFIILMMKRA